MTLDKTLAKIEHDLQVGDLGKARDRIHGLIANYPDNLALRRKLGAVYWRLQMPEMAGRYWYLEEHKDQEMTSACNRFEAQFGNDPMLMLFALRFRGNIELIKDTYPGRLLSELDRRAKEKHRGYENFQRRGAARFQKQPSELEKHKTRNSIIQWGCIILAILSILFFLAGVIDGIMSITRWLT